MTFSIPRKTERRIQTSVRLYETTLECIRATAAASGVGVTMADVIEFAVEFMCEHGPTVYPAPEASADPEPVPRGNRTMRVPPRNPVKVPPRSDAINTVPVKGAPIEEVVEEGDIPFTAPMPRLGSEGMPPRRRNMVPPVIDIEEEF